MRIAIGADHAGLPLKQELSPWLEAQGHELQDVGAHDFHPGDDYPDYAEAVARAVADGEVTRGIMVCGSGVGARASPPTRCVGYGPACATTPTQRTRAWSTTT